MLSNDKEFSKKNHELFCDFQKKHYLCTRKKEIAEIAQLVEHNLAKVGVASSSLVFRSFFLCPSGGMVDALVSGASVERRAGSIPVLGTSYCGNSSVGRAQPCQGWGREFESRFPLNKNPELSGFFFVLWSLPYYLLPMKSKIMEMITNVRSASFDFKFFSLKINAPHKNDTITEPRRIMETILIMAPSRLSE